MWFICPIYVFLSLFKRIYTTSNQLLTQLRPFSTWLHQTNQIFCLQLDLAWEKLKEVKSAINVVEDSGEDCVGHQSKKYSRRQDPSLWDIFQYWLWNNIFLADSSTLIVLNMIFIGNWLNISPVTLSALSQKPLQHFPPATSFRSSSFTLLASTIALFSLISAFSKIWKGMI